MTTDYKMTKEEHQAAAEEIRRQLGGRMFSAMVGAKYYTYSSELNTPNLSCKIQAGRKVTHMKIVLDPDDTYTMTLYKFTGEDLKVIDETSGLYNDMLADHFESVTGLYTRM